MHMMTLLKLDGELSREHTDFHVQTAIAALKTAVPKPTAPITQSQSCLARCAAAAGAPAAAAAAAPTSSG